MLIADPKLTAIKPENRFKINQILDEKRVSEDYSKSELLHRAKFFAAIGCLF